MNQKTNNQDEQIQRRLQTDFFAESRLLGAIYANPQYLENPEITDDLFSSQSTKNIYNALCNLKSRGITFSRDALVQEYSVIDLNANDYIVDKAIEASIEAKDVDLKDIIEQTKDFAKRRELSATFKSAQKLVDASARLTPEEVDKLNEYLSQSNELINTYTKKHIKGLKTWSEIASTYLPVVRGRVNGKEYYYRNFIFDMLVEGGPEPGEIGLIASASGSGKSTVCSVLVNSLIENKIPTLWYATEMSEVASMDRLMSKRTGIRYKDIKNPPEDDFEAISQAIEQEMKELEENELFMFSDDPDVSLKSLEADIKSFMKKLSLSYCIVVIDLLSMVRDFAKFMNGMNLAQGIELAMNVLSAIAKRCNCHIIGTLQLKRDNEKQTANSWDELDKFRPNRADIKNAGAWLERARYVITSFRKKMYAELCLQPEEYADEVDEIEVSIVKQNNGELGKTVKALFDPEHFDIIPFAKSWTEEQDEAYED